MFAKEAEWSLDALLDLAAPNKTRSALSTNQASLFASEAEP